LLSLSLPRLSWLSDRTPIEENPVQSASSPSLNRKHYILRLSAAFCADVFNLLSLQYSPSPIEQTFPGEDNRRKEQQANRCPLQQAEPGAADSSNRKGETDE
jgi:hypothetical protein